MTKARAPRDHQRGNTLLLAMIVLSALATLGSLTIVSVQGSFKASTHDRSQTIAMLTAESGAAVAMDYLRKRYRAADKWSAFVNPNNSPPFLLSNAPGEMPSNGAQPPIGPTDPTVNLLSTDQNAWYSVVILNNGSDLNFATAPGNNDADGRIIIQSTGHGPQGSLAIIEWEVQRYGEPPPSPTPTQVPPDESPFVLVSWRVVL
jgi:Tfp pilus assembly protein PilX